jgi:isoleucyl-tRNA synthetase
LVHSLRKKQMIKVRQPLQRILIPVLNDKMKQQVEAVSDLIMSEVNVKQIEYIDDTSGILVKKIKPNFKKLGQVFGPKMKLVAAAVQQMNQDDIAHLEREGGYEIMLSDDETAVLTPDDVEISSEDIPGWLVANEGKLTVALDITLTEELKQEGISRELVNRIQNLRKDSNLEVQDRIHILMQRSAPEVNEAVMNYSAYICSETQALTLDIVEELASSAILEIDNYTVLINIKTDSKTL